MKYIKYFNEKIQISPQDDISLTDKKNLYNKIEGYLLQLDQKKRELENIYLNYKDKTELLSKLVSGKFIKDNQTDNIIFENPLLSSFASFLNLKRKLQDSENVSKEIDDKYKTPQQNLQSKQISPIEEIQKTVQQQKEKNQSDILDIRQRLQKEEDKHKKNLDEMKKKLIELDNEINNYKK